MQEPVAEVKNGHSELAQALMLFIPTAFDLIATVLMNVGLLSGAARAIVNLLLGSGTSLPLIRSLPPSAWITAPQTVLPLPLACSDGIRVPDDAWCRDAVCGTFCGHLPAAQVGQRTCSRAYMFVLQCRCFDA